MSDRHTLIDNLTAAIQLPNHPFDQKSIDRFHAVANASDALDAAGVPWAYVPTANGWEPTLFDTHEQAREQAKKNAVLLRLNGSSGR